MSEKDIFALSNIGAPRGRFCVRHVEIILFIVNLIITIEL